MATTVMQSDTYSPTLNTNKRKRDSSDQADGGRALRSQEVNGEGRRANEATMSQISEQLIQSLGQNGDSALEEENQRTAQAALNTPMQSANYPAPDASFDSGSSGHYGLSFPDGNDMTPSTASQLQAAREVTMGVNKPAVGTNEWHVLRKNNHKEGQLFWERLLIYKADILHSGKTTPGNNQRRNQRNCQDRPWVRKEQGFYSATGSLIHHRPHNKAAFLEQRESYD
jgi:hypothetical protein